MTDTRVVSVRIESKSGPWDHVRVRELSGREAISDLFRFDVDVVCDAGHELPDDALPGEDVTLVVEIDGEEIRRIQGILGPIVNRLDGGDRATHRLRVVPSAYRLGLVETQEVYLDKTLPDIIKTKLERNGFGPDELEIRLVGAYPAREFVAQIRESDLAFVRRITEHAGVSFFFEHDGDAGKWVFTDHQNGSRPAHRAEQAHFRPRGEVLDVFALDLVTDLVPTSYVIQDYNYRTPLVDLSAAFDLASGNGGGVVEYGSHVKTPDESERLAKIRAEERLCRQRVYEGESSLPAFCAGSTTELVDHPKLPGTTKLLLIEVEHHAKFPVFSEDEAARTTYRNRFRAIPADVVFRPERRTPKPVVSGVVTGIIQPGSGGETGGIAQLDSEGRYLVQLHFDTAPPGEQRASHRMRMAQPFAGADYGMHFPLRPGTEVLLAFANGNPDRPLIVGALFNATSPSPVVSSNANQHRIKSPTGGLIEFTSKS